MKMGTKGIPGDFSKRGFCDRDVGKGRILAQVSLIKPCKDQGSDDLIKGLYIHHLPGVGGNGAFGGNPKIIVMALSIACPGLVNCGKRISSSD
jgi:hypothetical protein